jgi:hypothetical protein
LTQLGSGVRDGAREDEAKRKDHGTAAPSGQGGGHNTPQRVGAEGVRAESVRAKGVPAEYVRSQGFVAFAGTAEGAIAHPR